jgi:hypothetical protein
MNCEYFIRLIHLHRDGERTAAESRELEIHLSECKSCCQISRELKFAGTLIQEASEIPIGLAFPGIFTDQILAKCAGEKKEGWAIQFFSWLQNIRLQTAFACIALLIAGSFIFENLSINRKILSLEDRMQSKRFNTGAVSIDPGDMKKTAEFLSYIMSHSMNSEFLQCSFIPMEARGIIKTIHYYKGLTPWKRKMITQQLLQSSKENTMIFQ